MKRLNVSIRVSPDWQERCHQQAGRSSAIRLTNSDSFDAVVTDDAEFAMQLESCPVLLLQPMQSDDETIQTLVRSSCCRPGLTERWRPSVQQTHAALSDGRLGHPGLLRVHVWNSNDAIQPRQVAEQLDLALWLFADSPDAVYAVERTSYLQVHLGFPAGGMAMLDFDGSLSEDNRYDSVSLIGSTGAVYADDHANRSLLLHDLGTSAVRTGESDTALAGLLNAFATDVLHDNEPAESMQDVANALRLTQAVLASAASQVVSTGAQHV